MLRLCLQKRPIDQMKYQFRPMKGWFFKLFKTTFNNFDLNTGFLRIWEQSVQCFFCASSPQGHQQYRFTGFFKTTSLCSKYVGTQNVYYIQNTIQLFTITRFSLFLMRCENVKLNLVFWNVYRNITRLQTHRLLFTLVLHAWPVWCYIIDTNSTVLCLGVKM